MVTKSRRYQTATLSGTDRLSGFHPPYNYSIPGRDCYEYIISDNHRKYGTGWEGGGPMFLDRNIHEYIPERLNVIHYNGFGVPLGEGTVAIAYPTDGVLDLMPPPHPSESALKALGTTAIARTEPTNPSFDLAVLLGELRAEGLPNVPGATVMEQTRRAKKAGGEYLNVEFGWLPLVRGIQDFSSTVEKSDDIIRSYQEHANIPIKRSYEWPTYNETRTRSCTFSEVGGRGFFIGGGRSEIVSQRTWFEASYIYYLPTGGSANDKIRRFGSYARKLYGIDLSPEVLWNLAPWSWAADWFGNTGDIMHNISAFGQDGMVMRYGYIMCHTRRETWDWGYHTSDPKARQDYRVVTETKSRLPASPFGFGVSFDSLSAKQIAIVSALGLSRW